MDRVLVAIACVAALALSGCGSSEPPPPPILEIAVAEVIVRDQPISMEMVGQTSGSSDIPIRARVEGVLTSMTFDEGRAVTKDQLLYTIDPVPFQSEVIEAEGRLAASRTELAKAKADLDRIKPLAEMNAVSQADLDGAVAQYEAAIGTVQSSVERVKQAEIQLGYTRLHAPISGRIGISEARVGEFVGREPNPVVLNFVSRTDPIRVRFSIDERTYLSLVRHIREVREETGERPKMGEGLELKLADGTIHPHRGRIAATDAAVDASTGTFTLEADFPNPEEFVLAGQFARVTAVSEVRPNAILIPSRAISELQGNYRAFVIDSNGQVEMRPLELGQTIDNLRIVTSGLKAGERVAIEIIKLRPGMKVKPKLTAIQDDGKVARTSASPNKSPGESTSADAPGSGN